MEKKGGSESSSSEKPQQPMFGIDCSDDVNVLMDPRCFYESEILYSFLEHKDEMRAMEAADPRIPMSGLDGRDISVVGCTFIPKRIALMVNEYCVERFNIMTSVFDLGVLSEKLREFESKFVREKPLPVLVQLLNAAIELRIKSLMNLVYNAIHDGNFADAIFNMCGIKNFEIPFYVRNDWTIDEPDSCQKAQPGKHVQV